MKKLLVPAILYCFNMLYGFVQTAEAGNMGISFDGITGNFNVITGMNGGKAGSSNNITGHGNNFPGIGSVCTWYDKYKTSHKEKCWLSYL